MGARSFEHGGVRAIAVNAEALAVLPGSGFADCYGAELPGTLTAPQLVDALFARPPVWFGTLMSLRDRVTSLFGLKPAGNGAFPVVSSDDGAMVLGFDDRHLDFRLFAQAVPVDGGRTAFRLTTLVRTHNLLGRVYLAAVLPFHRYIARTMLAELVRRVP